MPELPHLVGWGWESSLLVSVDNATLKLLMDSTEAMAALMKIEGFRSLNAAIGFIINKSESVKKACKDADKFSADKKSS